MVTIRVWILAIVLCQLKGVLPRCKQGTPKECTDMSFVPGLSLMGQGFNAVTLKSTGTYVFNMDSHSLLNRSCQVCRNPINGIKQWQKLPLFIGKWHIINECDNLFTRATKSANEVSKDNDGMTKKVWHVGLHLGHTNGWKLRGPQSEMYNFVSKFRDRYNIVFSTQRYTCSKYRLDISRQPQLLLSPEFAAAVQRLSHPYSYSNYLPFIQTYGTHFIAQGKLGGMLRRIVAMDICLAALNDITIEDVNSCFKDKILMNIGLGHTSSLPTKCEKIFSNRDTVAGGRHKIMENRDDRKGGSAYVEVTSDPDTFRKWSASLHDSPELVSYNLKPLHQLVSDREIRKHLQAAIITYMKQNDIRRSSQPSCSDCCPRRGWMRRGNLRVYDIYAKGLYGDISTKSDSYVTFQYGYTLKRTNRIDETNYPRWSNELYFEDVAVGKSMVFHVYDVDPFGEDHLGGCSLYIKAGSHYLNSCGLNDGRLYFDYEFTCDRHLSGEYCQYYDP